MPDISTYDPIIAHATTADPTCTRADCIGLHNTQGVVDITYNYPNCDAKISCAASDGIKGISCDGLKCPPDVEQNQCCGLTPDGKYNGLLCDKGSFCNDKGECMGTIISYTCGKDPDYPGLPKCVPDYTHQPNGVKYFQASNCDNKCVCPSGYSYWGGQKPYPNPEGCYKNIFNRLTAEELDIKTKGKWDNTCYVGSTDTGLCGPGWSVSAEGNCANDTWNTMCSVYCTADTIPEGAMYSDHLKKWHKCAIKGGCSLVNKWGSLYDARDSVCEMKETDETSLYANWPPIYS